MKPKLSISDGEIILSCTKCGIHNNLNNTRCIDCDCKIIQPSRIIIEYDNKRLWKGRQIVEVVKDE